MRIKIFFTLLLVIALAAPVLATSLKQITPQEMTQKADLITLGTVKKINYVPSQDGKIVYTQVNILLEKVYKGKEPQSILVRVPGGKLGDKTLSVLGAPVFSEGLKTLLFLRKVKDDSSYRVIGLFQGRYLIFNEKGNDFAFMDNGQGKKALDKCPSMPGQCLKNLGYTVISINEFERKINKWCQSLEGVK